jgi:hypothetical protein
MDRAAHVHDASALSTLLAESASAAQKAVRETDLAADAIQALGAQPLRDLDVSRDVALEQLDTPDTRALLVALSAALPIAERIDAARGRSLPEAMGGSAGTDLAEDIGLLIARLELEIHGPSDNVTGGRE